MSVKPHTQYTKSGSINIAYQVFGAGPIDLVYIPGWISNIDWMWACPELVSFLTELGKVARVILFDKRGTGLSDRVVELSTLEERMDDIRAVMDAVGSEKAALFGHSEGGSVSALFAATYPDRTLSLLTFGIFAKRIHSPEYPWAPTPGERQLVYDMIENNWGTGKMNLASLAPSKANDKVFMEWLANYFRSGASPSAAMVLTKMNTEVDIINILPSIKVPSLIMQRKDDIDVKIEEGRFIAQRIQGAKYVELEGDDHLFWVGNTQAILDEIKAFLIQQRPAEDYEERLYSIAMIRSASKLTDGESVTLIDKLIKHYNGRSGKYDQHSFLATFDGPNKAVHCQLDLMKQLFELGTQIKVSIHITASIRGRSLSINDETARLLEAMQQQTKPNQLMVTQTVKNLLSGSGLSFSPYNTLYQDNYDDMGEALRLFVVTDQSGFTAKLGDKTPFSRNNSFLENVLQSINKHLDNPILGIQILCRELGVSERHLQRKLKAITNKTPIQMISSVRLHQAKQLLINSENTIAEVAFQTGFSSPSYFAKCFKKEFNLSPSQFKEKLAL